MEAISAAGTAIDPFLILPGVQIPVKGISENLPDNTTFTTSPAGYINDILACEWIVHFEKLTRLTDLSEMSILLLDGCENPFTNEIWYYAQAHNIKLFPFPPHLTHLLNLCMLVYLTH